MKSSSTLTADSTRDALLVREAGLPYQPVTARDPFEAWIALMEAVEALCPRWPAREHRMVGRFEL